MQIGINIDVYTSLTADESAVLQPMLFSYQWNPHGEVRVGHVIPTQSCFFEGTTAPCPRFTLHYLTRYLSVCAAEGACGVRMPRSATDLWEPVKKYCAKGWCDDEAAVEEDMRKIRENVWWLDQHGYPSLNTADKMAQATAGGATALELLEKWRVGSGPRR